MMTNPAGRRMSGAGAASLPYSFNCIVGQDWNEKQMQKAKLKPYQISGLATPAARTVLLF